MLTNTEKEILQIIKKVKKDIKTSDYNLKLEVKWESNSCDLKVIEVKGKEECLWECVRFYSDKTYHVYQWIFTYIQSRIPHDWNIWEYEY